MGLCCGVECWEQGAVCGWVVPRLSPFQLNSRVVLVIWSGSRHGHMTFLSGFRSLRATRDAKMLPLLTKVLVRRTFTIFEILGIPRSILERDSHSSTGARRRYLVSCPSISSSSLKPFGQHLISLSTHLAPAWFRYNCCVVL